MDLSGLLTALQSGNTVAQIGSAITGNANTNQVQQLVTMGVPTLLQAMSANASSKTGASALSSALSQHAGGNLESMLSNIQGVNASDGQKILGHLLGAKQNTVASTLSEKTGLNSSQVMQGLSMLAPIVMNFIGKQKMGDNGLASGLTSMLSALGGSNNNKMQGALGIASMLFDKDKDGSVLDDLGGMIGGMFGKKKN